METKKKSTKIRFWLINLSKSCFDRIFDNTICTHYLGWVMASFTMSSFKQKRMRVVFNDCPIFNQIQKTDF